MRRIPRLGLVHSQQVALLMGKVTITPISKTRKLLVALPPNPRPIAKVG